MRRVFLWVVLFLVPGFVAVAAAQETGEPISLDELLGEIDSLSIDSLQFVVDPLVETAIATLETGDLSSAAAELEDVLLQHPGHPQALRLLASTYLKLKDTGQAIQTCLQISALDSLDDGVLAAIGYLHQKQVDIDQAELYYNLALERNPESYHALFGLGWLDLERGRLESALDRATRVTQLAPIFAENHILIGRVLTAQGFYTEAARAYRQALSLNPDLRDRYGILLQELTLRHRMKR